ncbi:MAG: nicotinamide-nucleotide amidohydrolase family protein [Eubacteriales bacterium]|nr:nicotinamide-nucleotide amidohydrolase family protein [Eubacteriales bacterium]
MARKAEPEKEVFALLTKSKLTLAAAESCTGGLIAERITNLPGASNVFVGGVVSYTNQVKAKVLGVEQALLDEFGAVSEPVAKAMAEGVRAVTGADLGVSVTGVAGPASDERNNPVGTVYLALATQDGTSCTLCRFGDQSRERIRSLAADSAFDMVRQYLEK